MATMTEDMIAQSLAQDRPTIDAAVKTYMSWVAARSLTEEGVALKVSNGDALQFARMLLKAINGTKLNDGAGGSSASRVVTQVWNGLVDSDQKPSRFLGRIALLHAWDNVRENVIYPAEQLDQASLFVEVFGTLMKQYKKASSEEALQELDEDSNAHLIWDQPGIELERRRQRRAKRAEDAKERERSEVKPIIEELEEECEETENA